MGRNIAYQISNAINQSFQPGIDKHSEKAKQNYMHHVYSYSERANLNETGYQLGKFIKNNYADIKMAKDIKPGMVQEFLNSKANTCSRETLGQIVSRVNKISVVINKAYHCNTAWRGQIFAPASQISDHKVRDIAMERTDLNKILNYAYKNNLKANAITAVELSGRFGLRVSEGCKLRAGDIDFSRGIIHVHESKGGRSRDIEITNVADKEYLKKITKDLKANDRIVNIKEDSVNKWLSRVEGKLGIREKYEKAKTGIHCIRKMFAQELYDKYKAEGLSIKEALGRVSEYLGHGKNRIDVIRAYIQRL